MPSLEIALATYNSACFLPALLDSLFGQSRQGFTLLIADDGSADGTLAIISDYTAKHPGRIRLIARPVGTVGTRANFAFLVEHLTADYAMFCDHDDVWLPNKIALSCDEIGRQEALHGAGTPLLFHTDLCVTGPDLEVWNPSFWRFTNTEPARNSLPHLLMNGVAAGCTMIFNRALYELARPIPKEAPIHDWWMALTASAFGRITYSEEATILYRQHDQNVFGAVRWGPGHILRQVVATLRGHLRRPLSQQSVQAQALLDRFGDRLRPDQVEVARALATLWSTPRHRRFLQLMRHGLLRRGWLRNVALMVTVTFGDAEDLKA